MKMVMFSCGLLIGLTTLSLAMGSVPSSREVTNDTALYQSLSEIRTAKQPAPDFDGDIARLHQLESRYRENLPAVARQPRLAAPMARISKQPYRSTVRN